VSGYWTRKLTTKQTGTAVPACLYGAYFQVWIASLRSCDVSRSSFVIMSTFVTVPLVSMQTFAATDDGTSARFVLPTVGGAPEMRVTEVGGTTSVPLVFGTATATGVGDGDGDGDGATDATGEGDGLVTGGVDGEGTGEGATTGGFSTVLSVVAVASTGDGDGDGGGEGGADATGDGAGDDVGFGSSFSFSLSRRDETTGFAARCARSRCLSSDIDGLNS